MIVDCGFMWQTGDEPVDVCIRQQGKNHGPRHVSADGSWLLVERQAGVGSFGEPVLEQVDVDYAVTQEQVDDGSVVLKDVFVPEGDDGR